VKQIENATGGRPAQNLATKGGLDVVLDPVGGPYAEPAIRLLRYGGRYLVVGFASGGDQPKTSIPRIPLNLALLNERKILGVLYGTWRAQHYQENRAMIEELISMMEKGQIKSIVQAYAVKDWAKAVEDLMGRKMSGKVVFVNFDGSSSSANL